MFRKSRSLYVFMENKRQLLFNARSEPEIMGLLQPYNYDDPRLQEGIDIYNEADRLFEKQRLDYIAQLEAKDIFEKAYKDANDIYIEHVTLARLALDDEHTKWLILALDGKRSRTLAGWLRQANEFYNNAVDNPEILEKIAVYGLTNEKLLEGKGKIKKVEISNDNHDKAKGTAQQSTIDRNNALKALEKWTFAFIQVCRLAFKDKPQLLEKLGIPVLSEGYKRKSENKDDNGNDADAEAEAEEEETQTETAAENENKSTGTTPLKKTSKQK